MARPGLLVAGHERGQPAGDVLGAHAGGPARSHRGERVGHHVRRPATERTGHVGDGKHRAALACLRLGELAVDHLVTQAACRLVPGQHLVAGHQAEHPDDWCVRAHGRAVGQRGRGRVVGVEHD